MPKSPHIGVSLPEESYAQIKRISEKEKRSISSTTRILIEDKLKETAGNFK